MSARPEGLSDPSEPLAVLATAFTAQLGRFIEESARRQLAAPELAGCDREVQAAVREATASGAEVLARSLRMVGPVTGAVAPSSAPMAQTAALHDIPLAVVLRCYRLSHAVAVDHLLQYAEQTGAPMAAVCAAVRNLFGHMDAIVAVGSRVYVEERRRINSRPERAKYLRIKAVLDGAGGLGLGYPLDAHHVAIVLRGPQPAATLAAVAEAAGGAPLLVCGAPDGKVWGWVACEMCEYDVVAALTASARGPLAGGVSGHEPGVQGFRAAHRRAQLALQLGSVERRAVTTFAEVALEALAVGGEELAREFVSAELGELGAEDRRTRVTRETLAAFFSGGGAAAAAERLRVSERTVTYRLRHAESILGRPVAVRRAELEMALRLHHLLGGAANRAA